MINSILRDKDYTEIIKLRNYFVGLAKSKIRTEFDYGNPEHQKMLDIVKDIDEILMAKYLFETNNCTNYDLIPDN